MLDSSFAPSDDLYEREGYLVEWKKIQFMSMEEVKELDWESKYLGKNWSTLETAKMSEPFMRVFSDCINWFQLKRNPGSLSKKFKEDFQDRLK